MFIVTGSLRIQKVRSVVSAAILAVAALALISVQSTQAIARGYETTDSGLQVGMVAALSTEGSSTVERATQSNTKRAIGVVTTFDSSSVTLASGQSKILVESEGEVQVYIADLGGSVKQGDELIMSPLKGILMKADKDNAATVLAIASQDVTYDSDDQSQTVDQEGVKKEVRLTRALANLNRQGTNANSQKEDSPLAKLGKAIVGRDVGATRVLVALIIFITVLIAEGGIIYGAVTSSITALGRNPMASKIIRKGMLQVMTVAIGVLFIGLGAIYGILWF